MFENIDLYCILGPTASGKTRLAALTAETCGADILSADSRQVYRNMNIGTGKDLDDYQVGDKKVPYHLIDIVDPGSRYNVFEYQQDFLKAYQVLKVCGRNVILCGGSGMYLESVLLGYKMAKAIDESDSTDELEEFSDDELIEELSSLAPLHNTTDTLDRTRLIKAIQVARANASEKELDFPELRTKVYGIKWEREELKARITKRLKTRIANGLIDEVRDLLDSGLNSKQLMFYGLEYRYVTQHVIGQMNRNDMFQKLNSAIHQFAKRQMTWFRRMERKGIDIEWLDGPSYTDRRVIKI